MIDNRELVSRLVAEGRLCSCCDPSRLEPPAPGRVPWTRAAGMLLGLAVGDALGNTSESLTPAGRGLRFGEIRDYLRNECAGGREVGLPSDDTQLAFWTLEQLLEEDGLVPERLARRFAGSGRIFGIGSTVRAFLRELDTGTGWLDAKQQSAGNGALMRIAPILLPHLRRPTTGLWADALLCGAVTHDDFASNACCVAFVQLLWDALAATPPVPRGFWLSRFERCAAQIEGGLARYEARAPAHAGRPVRLTDFTVERVEAALRQGRCAAEACDDWHSGAYLLETMPSVLFILERHGNDAEEAIVRAVNDTRDNDTVAAIVGAAVGALHGEAGLPQRWLRDLLGCTRLSDHGRVQELVALAGDRWATTRQD